MTFTQITLVRELWPTVLALCIAVGSLLLWSRTMRLSALLQLIGSAVFLIVSLLSNLRLFTTPSDESWISRLLWSSSLDGVTVGTVLVCGLVFSIGYLWYAVTQIRSR